MKNYQNIKHKGKALLIGGIMIPTLFFTSLTKAKENLEEKILKINFNYLTESYRKRIKFSTSNTFYESTLNNSTEGNLNYFGTALNINLIQKNQVEKILQNIENKTINSYTELFQNNQNLSQDQNLLLGAAFGDRLARFHYDYGTDALYETFSQNIFFNTMQNSMITGNQSPLGVCRQIASHVEKYLNDSKITSATATGLAKNNIGHAYAISKTENSTTIIDYGDILRANTKNIEKTLEAYQFNAGSTAIYHSFFKDNEFKYRLITRDGKNFLNFTEYDETTDSLKKNSPTNESTLQFSIDYQDYLKAMEFNFLGFFFKGGQIKGDKLSPLKKANLYQIGFKRNFLIPDKDYIFPPLRNVKIDGSISSITGKLYQNLKGEETTAKINGFLGHFIFDTNNQKGFNWKFKVGGISTQGETKEHAIFSEYSLESKVDYVIQTKNTNIKPYILAQYKNFSEDLGTWKHKPTLKEYSGGIVLEINHSQTTNISIDSYYTKRIWEQEYGANIKFNHKKFMAGIEGYLIKSNYEFSPDKYGFKIQTSAKISKNLNVQGNFETETIDYDGEKELQNKFGIKANLQF